MPEQAEEIPFAAEVARLFSPPEETKTYTMVLRCVECKAVMVALLPTSEGEQLLFGCPQCTRSVEVSFS